MHTAFLAFIAAPLAMQAAPAPTADAAQGAPPSLNAFSELPIEESTAPRCGIAFATVEGWQNGGDPRGQQYPNIEEAGGREFFVRAMVGLIDKYSLEREDVMRLVEREVEAHEADEGAAIEAMMPACLALLQVSYSD